MSNNHCFLIMASLLGIATYTSRGLAQPDKEPSYRGRPLSVWIKQLESDNEDQRTRAVRSLGEMGLEAKAAAPALIRILHKDTSVIATEAAAYSLRTILPPNEAVPALIEAMKKSQHASRTASFALHRFADTKVDAVAALIEALRNKDGEVRLTVVWGLGNYGAKAKSAIPALAELLKDPETWAYEKGAIGNSIFHAFTGIGPDAAPIVVEFLKHKDGASRTRAAQALIGMQPPATMALQPLLDVLKDRETPGLRHHALSALVEIGSVVKWDMDTALPVLIAASTEADATRQQKAVVMLGKLGANAKPAIPKLIEIMHAESHLGIAAAESLGEIGLLTDAVLPALKKSALNPGKGSYSFAVQPAATKALGKIGPEGVPLLIEVMKKHGSRAAMETLSGLKPDLAKLALPGLIETLRTDEACQLAAEALGNHHSIARDAIPALIETLQKTKNNERFRIAETIGKFGSAAKAAVPVLITSVKEDRGQVRSMSVWALGQIGPDASEAVPVLVSGLFKVEGLAPDFEQALIRIGDSAVPDLMKAASNTGRDFNAHASITRVLVAIGPAAAPSIAKGINAQSDEKSRMQAAHMLKNMGPRAKSAVPLLGEALKEKELGVAYAAAYALEAIGPEAKEAMPALIATLKNDDPKARNHAVGALGQFWQEAKTVVPALMDALKDNDRLVRYKAANALGKMGTEGKKAIPALEAATRDSDDAVRSAAGGAIRTLNQPPIADLIKALKSEDKLVRSRAAATLAVIGPLAREAVPALIDSLQDTVFTVRSAAATALGSMGAEAKSAVPRLVEMLKSPDENDRVKRSVEAALKRIDPNAIP